MGSEMCIRDSNKYKRGYLHRPTCYSNNDISSTYKSNILIKENCILDYCDFRIVNRTKILKQDSMRTVKKYDENEGYHETGRINKLNMQESSGKIK